MLLHSGALRRQLGGHRLQGAPDRIDLDDVLPREDSNEGSLTRSRDNEPFLLQHPDRFPKWGPADPQLVRQPLLIQSVAWFQEAFQDRLSEDVCDFMS